MCGIAGLLHHTGRPVEGEVVAAMVATLTHRGPDQSGALTAGPLGLAATRLSLIDPGEAGDQPWSDGRRALTFNGEVYNHRILAADLIREGVVLRGHSDTEVVFHALSRWGVEAALHRFQGMFALAYADLELGEVWLARDRLGIKPLVWTEYGDGVAWASEAKALAPVRPLEPDPVQAVFAVAGRIERSARNTAFLGVHRLAPGHLLHLAPGHPPRPRRWWSLGDLVDEEHYRDLAGLDNEGSADRLEALLSVAVESMLASDAPIGVFTSGGVDSSLLAALAARSVGPPVLYAADIKGPASEAGAARTVAAHLDRPLRTAPFTASDVLEDWALATWHAETPIVTHMNALAFRRLASYAAADGAKGVLTGEGADELFFGYGEIAAGRMGTVAGAPMAAARRLAGRLPAPVGPALARRATDVGSFLVELAGDRSHARLAADGAAAFAFLGPGAARQGEVYPWLGEHLPTLLHRNDAMGMAASLEARFPFLDEEVLRFGVNLPTRAKLTLSRHLGDLRHPFVRDKAVLRRVAARHLPDATARREKAGFPSPGHAQIRTTAAFWTDGYVQEVLRLTAATVDDLADAVDPYLAAKLASVEVFGRLYARRDTVDAVTDHLRCTARCTNH